tara:strand:+ start:566 stop:847 length:282 start_codon:yes stop_codon:yes gene_type:complete
MTEQTKLTLKELKRVGNLPANFTIRSMFEVNRPEDGWGHWQRYWKLNGPTPGTSKAYMRYTTTTMTIEKISWEMFTAAAAEFAVQVADDPHPY